MSTPEDIFTELQDHFSYEKPITELIISKGRTTLAEFSHYCNGAADVVATFITSIAIKLSNERLMGARLKMAWTAVVAGEKAKESASIEGVALRRGTSSSHQFGKHQRCFLQTVSLDSSPRTAALR